MLIGLVIFGIIVDICEYYSDISKRCQSKDTYIKLKFSTFRDFYSMNPNRWNTSGSCPLYTLPTGMNKVKYFYIYFSYIDEQRYIAWCVEQIENKKELQNLKATTEFTNAIREDIAKAKIENQSRIDEQVKLFTEVKNRIELELKKEPTDIIANLDNAKCVTDNPDKIEYELAFDSTTNQYYIQNASTKKRLK